MFRIVPCLMSDISENFHETPLIFFLLTGTGFFEEMQKDILYARG